MSAQVEDLFEQCHSQQEEEVQVLQSIYEPDQLQIHERRADGTFTVVYKCCTGSVIRAKIPPLYPAHEAPAFEVEGGVSIGQASYLAEQMKLIHSQHEGQVSLFDCLSWCEQHLLETQQQQDGQEEGVKGEAPTRLGLAQGNEDESEESIDDNDIIVHHGDSVTEKKSTFQAHVATVKSKDDTGKVMAKLLANKKIKKATHNISAYRFFDEAKNCWISDNDDDGETGAGQKLASLLELIDAKDVIVIVSRWFGGVLLGPARFRYINNVARELLEEKGYSNRSKTAKHKH